MQVCHTANFFPAKGGISRIYSPYMILNEKKVDYKKFFPCEFGAYVEANNYTNNTNSQRTISAIYLRPASNLQRGYELLDLQTKQVVTRTKITEIPITKQVIDIVERWAEEEGFKSLKFYDRNKNLIDDYDVIQDADLIAGVDGAYLDEIDLDYNEEHHGNPHDVELTGVDEMDENEINDLIEDQAIHGGNQDIDEDIDQNNIEEIEEEEEEEEILPGLISNDDTEDAETSNTGENEQENHEDDDDDDNDDDDDEDDDNEPPPLINREHRENEDDDLSVGSDDEETVDYDAGIDDDNVDTSFDSEIKEHEIEFMTDSEFEPEEKGSEPKSPSVRRSSRTRKPTRRLDPDWNEKKYDETEPSDRNPRIGNFGPTYAQVVKNNSKRSNENKMFENGNRENRENDNKPRKVTFAECDGKSNSVIFSQLADGTEAVEYSEDLTPVVMMILEKMIIENNLHEAAEIPSKKVSFVQQYLLEKGLKKFGEDGRRAAMKEMKQLLKRVCFAPIRWKSMSKREKKRAQRALMYLTEKSSGEKKGRMVYNGKPTRAWLSTEDKSSPTASQESLNITTTIDAHEKRDIMTADVPNAYIQALMPPRKEGEDRVTMKISGALVDMVLEIDPIGYADYVVEERGQRVIYVEVLRALYGMLESALIWYQRFRNDLEKIGFVFNPYDGCVANRTINGKQHTVRFHVDDLLSSHVDPKVNDKFLSWLNEMYGAHGEVKATRGKVHSFLGVTYDFSIEGCVKLKMEKYVEKMISDFSVDLHEGKSAPTPAGANLFSTITGKKLEKARAEEFHSMIARGLFLSKRARPDIQPVIAVLATRIKDTNEGDWAKLVRLMKYLKGTKELCLTLKASENMTIKWYVDASFGVHPDMKSHTGAVMMMGAGAIIAISRKQKLNTRSSTEAELVGVDDVVTMVMWAKLFVEAQGYKMKENIVFQDNKSTILLAKNGRRSAGKRSRALNIRYFYVTDLISKGSMNVVYCPTNDMIGDFMTKPLQGMKFIKFRNMILGIK